MLIPQEPSLALDPTMKVRGQMALAGIAHGAIPATLVPSTCPSRRLRAIHSCCPAAWPSACWSRRPLASALPSSLPTTDQGPGCRPGFAGDRSLEAARGRGRSLLAITHDRRVAEELDGDLAIIREGRILEQGPSAIILNQPATEYTRAWARRRPAQLAALPSMLRHGSAGALRPRSRFRLARSGAAVPRTRPPSAQRRRAGGRGPERKRQEHARRHPASVSGGRTRAASNGGARTSSRTRQSSARSARDTRSCTRIRSRPSRRVWRSDGSCIPSRRSSRGSGSHATCRRFLIASNSSRRFSTAGRLTSPVEKRSVWRWPASCYWTQSPLSPTSRRRGWIRRAARDPDDAARTRRRKGTRPDPDQPRCRPDVGHADDILKLG